MTRLTGGRERWIAAIVGMVLSVATMTSFAQERLAVLSVDFGEEGAVDVVTEVSLALSSRADVAQVPPDEVTDRARRRYAPASGVDLGVVGALVERGENAYLEMRYADSVEALSAPQIDAAGAALVDMAHQPDLGMWVRRAQLGRARAQLGAGEDSAAEVSIRRSLARFPYWQTTTQRYQPTFVEYYERIRANVLEDTVEVVVTTSTDTCEVSVNGHPVGQQRSVSVALPRETYALRVTCESGTTEAHVVEIDAPAHLWLDPDFDAQYDPSSNQLTLSPDDAEDFDVLLARSRAFGSVAGADRVVLAGELDQTLYLVLADLRESPSVRVVRARSEEGEYPVDDALAALIDEAVPPNVSVNDGSGWQGRADEGQVSVLPWVLLGVGGAGLILGTVFAIDEASSYDDFEACRSDPGCATTPRLDSLREDSERSGILATIGFGVGAAGVIAGGLLLLLERGSENAESDEPAGVALGGEMTGTGGSLVLHWRF